MKNKILVEIIIPTIEKKYDVYIPINRRIGSIITLLCKSIQEMNDNSFISNSKIELYNKETKERYDPNDLVYNTNIRNGTSLILL